MKEPVVSDDLRCRKLDTQSDTTTGLEIEKKASRDFTAGGVMQMASRSILKINRK